MKKLFLSIFIFCFVSLYSINTFAILYTAGSLGPVNVMKTSAISVFSPSSWMTSLSYDVYEIDNSDVKIEMGTNTFDYKVVDNKYYRGKFEFGFIRSNGNSSFLMYVGSDEDNLISYTNKKTNLSNTALSLDLDTDEKELVISPKVAIGSSYKLSENTSIGFKVNFKHKFMNKVESETPLIGLGKYKKNTENVLKYDGEISLFKYFPLTGASAGMTISTGDFRFLRKSLKIDDKDKSFEDNKTTTDYFEYNSSPFFIVGGNSPILTYFELGVELGLSFPNKYDEVNLKYNDSPMPEIVVNEVETQSAYMFMTNVSIKWKPSDSFLWEIGFSRISSYNETELDNKVVGRMELSVFQINTALLYKTKSEMFYIINAVYTNDESEMMQDSPTIMMNVNAHRNNFQITLGLGKSY